MHEIVDLFLSHDSIKGQVIYFVRSIGCHWVHHLGKMGFTFEGMIITFIFLMWNFQSHHVFKIISQSYAYPCLWSPSKHLTSSLSFAFFIYWTRYFTLTNHIRPNGYRPCPYPFSHQCMFSFTFKWGFRKEVVVDVTIRMELQKFE